MRKIVIHSEETHTHGKYRIRDSKLLSYKCQIWIDLPYFTLWTIYIYIYNLYNSFSVHSLDFLLAHTFNRIYGNGGWKISIYFTFYSNLSCLRIYLCAGGVTQFSVCMLHNLYVFHSSMFFLFSTLDAVYAPAKMDMFVFLMKHFTNIHTCFYVHFSLSFFLAP